MAFVPVPASTAPARAADPTCQGQAATVAPDADGLYLGTAGPDVIVVAAPGSRVESGAGDDLICVDAAQATKVDAGEGDDGVYVRDVSAYTKMRVETLGPGDDTFVGGPGADKVTGTGDGPPTYDQGHDQIATRGGSDYVLVGSEGYGAHHVDVDLGRGNDYLGTYSDGVTADSTLLGGLGYDRLDLRPDYQVPDIVVDARSHTIESGGSRIVSSWQSLEDFNISGSSVRFEGTPGNDHVTIAASVVDVTMRSGRDVVDLWAAKGAVRGGAGRDKIIGDRRLMHVDLARRELVWGGNRVVLTSFQDASSADGEVTGSGEDNVIVVGRCGTVRGGGGDDRIRQFDTDLSIPRPTRCRFFAAYGGPGNDILRGSQGPDRLVGGTGRDVAYGLKGRDVCLVESAHDCEQG